MNIFRLPTRFSRARSGKQSFVLLMSLALLLAAATQKLEPRGKVQWILDALKLYVTEDVPAAFSQSSEAQRTAAATFMRTLRLGTLKKSTAPRGRRRGEVRRCPRAAPPPGSLAASA